MKFVRIGLMLWGGLVCGQTIIAPVIQGGPGVPTPPCVTGEMYFHSGAAAGQNLYVCADNTWTQINGVSANSARTDASNTYASGTTQSFQGALDASAATATLPAQTGAALPAACSAGQMFLKTGADPNRMLYVCSATNTWSQAAYGQGTIAQMPASCAPGQMYFATDAVPGQNLYLCTAANSWATASAGLSGSGAANQFAYFTGGTAISSDGKVTRNSSGDVTANSFGTAAAHVWGYNVDGGMALKATMIDNATCASGAASLIGTYSFHKVSLNNQASCAISFSSGGWGQVGSVLLCNGPTSATGTLSWSGAKGGMAAGGSPGQCAAQSFWYDGGSSTWYATSTGGAWN